MIGCQEVVIGDSAFTVCAYDHSTAFDLGYLLSTALQFCTSLKVRVRVMLWWKYD